MPFADFRRRLVLADAAPELLAALESLMPELYSCAKQLGCDWKNERWVASSSVGKAYTKARAAVAKAKGGPAC